MRHKKKDNYAVIPESNQGVSNSNERYKHRDRLEAVLKSREPILDEARERDRFRKQEMLAMQEQEELSKSQRRNISALVQQLDGSSLDSSTSSTYNCFDEEEDPISPPSTKYDTSSQQNNNSYHDLSAPDAITQQNDNPYHDLATSDTSTQQNNSYHDLAYGSVVGSDDKEKNNQPYSITDEKNTPGNSKGGYVADLSTTLYHTSIETAPSGESSSSPSSSSPSSSSWSIASSKRKKEEDKKIEEEEEIEDEVSLLSNWSERFRRVNADLSSFDSNTIMAKRISTNVELLHLSRDFLHSAQSYGKIIISEVYLPDKLKTILPSSEIGGIAGGEKYLVRNILFKFCVDNKSLYGSDENAMKVAGHELKGLMAYYNCWIPNLFVPMMAVIDYRGFRLTAVSKLPISKDTLVYGTNDGGLTYKLDSSELERKMNLAAERLRLRAHEVGNGVKLSTAADVEGHIVKNKYYYLIDLARALPPEACNREDLKKRAYLYKLLRPELLRMNWQSPLCSDTYSGFMKGSRDEKPSRREVEAATRQLFEIAVPKCSLLLLENLEQEWLYWNKHGSKDSLKDNPWSQGGYLRYFKMKQLVHSTGVNLRHLGKVSDCVHKNIKKEHAGDGSHSANASAAKGEGKEEGSHHDKPQFIYEDLLGLLWVEMCARTLRKLLNKRLRDEMKRVSTPLEQPFNRVVVNFLNLVFGKTKDSEEFWKGEMKDKILEKFGHLGLASIPASDPNFSYKDYLERLFLRNRSELAPQEVGRHVGNTLLFSKLRRLVGIQFEETVMNQYLGMNQEEVLNLPMTPGGRRKDADQAPVLIKKKDSEIWDRSAPFSEIDYVSSGEYVKHMNMIHHAQGYVFKSQALSEQQCGESSRAEQFFRRALKNFETVLDSDPTNKITLRNCGQVLSFLNNIRHPEDEYKRHQPGGRGKGTSGKGFNKSGSSGRGSPKPGGPGSPKLGVSGQAFPRKYRFENRQMIKKADEYYKSAVHSDPVDSYSLYQYATFLYRTGITDEEKRESEEYYLKSLEADPTHLAALGEFAIFLKANGYPTESKMATDRYHVLKGEMIQNPK